MPNDFLDQLKFAIQMKQQRELKDKELAQQMFQFKNLGAFQSGQLDLGREGHTIQREVNETNRDKNYADYILRNATLANTMNNQGVVNQREQDKLSIDAIDKGWMPAAQQPKTGIDFSQFTTPGTQEGVEPDVMNLPQQVSRMTPEINPNSNLMIGGRPMFPPPPTPKIDIDPALINPALAGMVPKLSGVDVTKLPGVMSAIKTAGDATGTTPQSINEKSLAADRAAGRKIQTDTLLENMRHNKATEEETSRYHNLTLEDFGGSLTPETIKKMAEVVAVTGQTPNLGMGRAAASMKAQIWNKATEMFKDVNFATAGAAYKANSSALTRIRTQRSLSKSFEDTALKNLDLFVNSAKKIVDTGSPLFNSPVRAWDAKVKGSVDMAAFEVARQVAITELAKLTSGAMGNAAVSDSARNEISKLASENATLGQIISAADMLKQDAHNRIEGFDSEINALTKMVGQTPNQQATPTTTKSPFRFDPVQNKLVPNN